MPRHGHDPRRPDPRLLRRRVRARRGRARPGPGVDDRLDERRGQAQADGVRHSPAVGSRRRLRPRAAVAGREVPAVRVARHARGDALRIDLVQGAVRVPRVPRALRLLQGALMTDSTTISDAEFVADALLAGAVGGPTASGRRRARFHPLRVAEVRPLTSDSVEVTFAVPADLVREYEYLPGQYVALRAHIDGQEVRRSYSLCRPPAAGSVSVAIKRNSGGWFSAWADRTSTRLNSSH